MRIRSAARPILIIAAFVTTVLISRAKSEPRAGEALSQDQVFAWIRDVNTEEYNSFRSTGEYSQLGSLAGRPFFQARKLMPSMHDESSGVFGDYKVSIVTSQDGKHYLSSMVPNSGCDLALFSNESGVIYAAFALGCPMTSGK